MATFQPILNQTSASPFIAPAVKNTAVGDFIASAGKLGVEAYTGYQNSELQKEIQASAEEYFNSNSEGELSLESQGTKVAGLVKGEEELLLSGIPEPEVQEQYTRGLATKLSSYQRAVQQGKMSIDQLQTRILSATREAVNRNPFLQRELLATADKYMELSGLGSYIKQQQGLQVDQAKAQQKSLENLDAEGREKDIPGWFNMSTEQKMGAIDMVRREEFVVKEAERISKSGQFVDAATFREWRDSGKLDQYHSGNFNRLNVQLQTIFRDNPTAGYSANQYAIRTTIQQAKEAYKLGIPASIRETPEVKQQIKDYNDALDKMDQDLSKRGSGEDMAKAVGYRVGILKDLQSEQLRKNVNPEHFDMLAKLKMADPSGTILGEGNLKAIDGYLSATFNKLFKTPAFQAQVPTLEKPNKASANVLSLAGQVGNQEKDWAPFKTIVDSYNTGLKDITDNKSKALFLAQNLQAISQMDLTGLDSAGVESVSNMVKSYLDDPSFGLRSMFGNAAKYNVSMDILEDGRLLFAGPDAKMFNEAYGVKINTALEAFAKANGLSVKAASGRFYQDFFSGQKMAEPLLEDKDIKAWNAQTPEQAFELFDNGTIDEPTYRTIVRDMMKGKQAPEQGTAPSPEIVTKPIETPTPVAPPPTKSSSPAKQGVKPATSAPKTIIKTTGAKDIYKPEPILTPEVKQKNKEVMERSKTAIAQAEKEIIGESILKAPMKHMQNQEAIMKRADAISRGDTTLYVSTDKERILASPNGKWVVYKEGDGKIRMYSPVEKVYVDIKLSDVPLVEKWFKKDISQWKRWEK
jgi:hypothetical protein